MWSLDGAELSGQGPTSGSVISTGSHGCCFALYKTELVFLLFLQYSQIWLQVSDKELTKGCLFYCVLSLLDRVVPQT